LAVSSLFVLPSLIEGLPGALIEAMAAMVPCIATDIPGNRELIKHGYTGRSFTPKNVKQLTSCIHEALSNTEQTNSLVNAAFELVHQHYNETAERSSWIRLMASIEDRAERVNDNETVGVGD